MNPFRAPTAGVDFDGFFGGGMVPWPQNALKGGFRHTNGINPSDVQMYRCTAQRGPATKQQKYKQIWSVETFLENTVTDFLFLQKQ